MAATPSRQHQKQQAGAAQPSTEVARDRYTFHDVLGHGAFGEVWQATDTWTGEQVAVKIIDLAECDDDIEEVEKEIQILRACSSEFVPKFIASFVLGEKLWIVMELMAGGSCSDILQTHRLSESQIAVILRDVLKGLKYLHSTGKIHRDIKAANILLSETGVVKLADFGVAGQLQSMRISKTHTTVGTPNWMAPEVILGSGHDTKADIWSLGITAIELAAGQAPHSGKPPLQIFKLIPTAPPPTLNGPYSPLLKDFVAQCLKKNPKDRPTAATLLRHPFVDTLEPPEILAEIVQSSKSKREEERESREKKRREKRTSAAGVPQQRTTTAPLPPPPRPLLKKDSSSLKLEHHAPAEVVAPRRSITAPVERQPPAKLVRILLPDDASDGSNSNSASSNPSTRSTVSSDRSHLGEDDKTRVGILSGAVVARTLNEVAGRYSGQEEQECVRVLQEAVSRTQQEAPALLADLCSALVVNLAESRVVVAREGSLKEPWSRESAVGNYMYKRWLDKCRARGHAL